MPKVSVIIPARNEQFLPQTIDGLCQKARGEIEVIAVLEGYWPKRVSEDKRVHYLHFPKPRGMRNALNAGVEIARGEFVMKLDGHCMVSEGFDVALADVCQPNWVCVPTRYRLNAEDWTTIPGRPPINYLFLDMSNDGLNGKLWDQKNRDRSLDALQIDDLIACQGSCYFLPKALWHELELLDVEHYGTFRKDPQEVVFKAWANGGRAVRAKGAWYAHLHKGKKYGRGYSGSRTDWRKGDEYVKQWWTGSAWPKQKIPLRRVIAERFADMPGWEDHEWTKGTSMEQDTSKLPRTYQILKLPDGQYFTRPRAEREHSRFWNEGKWHTFIEPLLPDDPAEQTFVEMGTAVGLFLKMATDHGFRKVIGVEKNKTPVRIGQRYRDAIGYDYQILKRSLGNKFHGTGNFNIDELPVADVTLMSTFHYHIDLNSWIKYLDKLRSKSCYVLLVSIPSFQKYRWRPGTSLNQVRGYFRDWEEVDSVVDVPQEGDSAPRALYSILFKSPMLERAPFSAITRNSGRGDNGVRDLARRIIASDEIDIRETLMYADWKQRKPRWKEKTLMAFLNGKHAVVRDVIENGPKSPLLVAGDKRRICDGGHRSAVLQEMGYKSAIVRRV